MLFSALGRIIWKLIGKDTQSFPGVKSWDVENFGIVVNISLF